MDGSAGDSDLGQALKVLPLRDYSTPDSRRDPDLFPRLPDATWAPIGRNSELNRFAVIVFARASHEPGQ